MVTAITNQTERNATLLSYEAIFELPASMQVRITTAVARLLTVKRQDLDQSVQAWSEQLSRYEPGELTDAFNRAELQIRAFPDIADIVDFIEKSRFHDTFALVLRGLAKHGVDWQRIPGICELVPPYAVIDLENPASYRVTREPVEMPELPRRVIEALEIFGQIGTMKGGLVRLKRDHPAFWTSDTEFATGQHGRQASMIERDFYQCWQEAK
jgi:hypothetical protein